MSEDQFEGLTEDHCRYIFGSPREGKWHFCRAPRSRNADGSLMRWMWCDQHREIVVSKHAWGRRLRGRPPVAA